MFKLIVLIFALINYSTCDRSLAIVLDVTGSMKEELNIIKANIGEAFGNNTLFDEYVLVTFKDSDKTRYYDDLTTFIDYSSDQAFNSRDVCNEEIGISEEGDLCGDDISLAISADQPYVYSKPKDLIRHVNSLTTRSGGRYCPENSLTGIEAALRNTKQESYIFVFTDAYARDHDKFDTIQNLCRESHSQVVIFLRGHCASASSSETGSVEVYDQIARSCAGAFFRFDVSELNELRQTFGFMRNITSTDWTNVTREQFNSYKQFTVSLDTYTTDFLIVATGSFPEIEVTSLYIAQNLDIVLGSKNTLVSRIIQPSQGTYTITVKGHGTLSTTFYERSYIQFEYGFSTKIPRDLRETSRRPIGGWTNYLLIKIDTSIQLRELEWLTFGDNAIKVVYLDQKRPGYFLASVFVEPGKTFRFWIKGQNVNTYQEIKASTKSLAPQEKEANPSWTKPIVEIFEQDDNLVNFGENITLVCKVSGYPKPNITWQTEDYTFLPSEDILLEMPNIHLSYLTLSNVTSNSTIYCKAVNPEGDDTQSVAIFVNRTFTFQVLQAPQDTDVEYGSELKLYCQVNAYPEATLSWSLNGTNLQTANIEDNALVIEAVDLDDGGEYACVVSNDVETRTLSAIVNIIGVEAPEIDKGDTEVLLKPGAWKDLQCSVLKGKPTPQISWQYKSFEGYSFDELPSGVETQDEMLRLKNVEKKHGGMYRCLATNVVGVDSKDVAVKIQHPPIIKNNQQENVTVHEQDEVSLPCDVESSPDAIVRWEMSQDDVMIVLDHTHTTDEQNTHRFRARWNDSGNYHCIAENNVGKAERTVFVNVLVPVYIESPHTPEVHATPGSDVALPCRVLYGNPPPTTKWEFNAPNSVPRLLNRGNTTNELRLTKVSTQHEGNYTCRAQNSINYDSIKYILKVHF